jgi:hypothetical protein
MTDRPNSQLRASVEIALPHLRGSFIARGHEETLPRFCLVPDGRQFPHAERRLMHSVAWPERKVGHGLAILVENRLPNFIVSEPGVDDQEIKDADFQLAETRRLPVLLHYEAPPNA